MRLRAWIALVSLAASLSTPFAESPQVRVEVENLEIATGDGALQVTRQTLLDSGTVEYRLVGPNIDLITSMERDGQDVTVTLTDSSRGPRLTMELQPQDPDRLIATLSMLDSVARFAIVEGEKPRLERGDLTCEAVSASNLYRSLNEALLVLSTEPRSFHSETLWMSLIPGLLLRSLPGCEEFQTRNTRAGGCYYDNEEYSSCAGCCAQSSLAWICPFVGVHGRACITVTSFMFGACVVGDCSGKPGDPSCNQSQSCAGTCLHFCGPGYDSSCGKCEDRMTPSCCR